MTTPYAELQDELEQVIKRRDKLYDKCRKAAFRFGNDINSFLGAKVTHYFNWDDSDGFEKENLRESLVWIDESNEPETCLGISIRIEVPSSSVAVGYRVLLRPNDNGVRLRMFENTAELSIAFDEKGEAVYADEAEKTNVFGRLLEELKTSIESVWMGRKPEHGRIGFHRQT